MDHGRVGEREELHEDEACDAVLVEAVPDAVHEEGSRKGLEAMAGKACRMSASRNAMSGDLPPSSNVAFMR